MDDRGSRIQDSNATMHGGHRIPYSRLPTDSQLGHRVRTPTEVLDKTEKSADLPDLPSVNASMISSGKLSQLISYVMASLNLQLSRKRSSSTKIVFILYCFMSCGLLSLAIVTRLYDTVHAPLNVDHVLYQEINPLLSLPVHHLLSKVTSIYPTPKAVDPFILKAAIDPTTITACLWSTDEDINAIMPWATRWKGPISLVMTTTAEPSSPEHKALLGDLAALHERSALLNTTLSLHLVHLTSTIPDNPNAFLNLARFFAQTPRIVFFPSNLSIIPPKPLYQSLLAEHQHRSESSAAIIDATASKATKQRPIVLMSRGQTSFPFSSLAPVVMGRDDSLWCTERFFAPAERAVDWEDCLWQIWLENFGEVEVRQTKGWLHRMPPAAPLSPVDSPVLTKLRKRLDTKFRSETCVLATRQLAAFRSADKALDAKKARWLKRVCRDWVNTSQS